LDEWFARFNEYCPLCHASIIPGRRAAKKIRREEVVAIPVALIV
jgi:E3 ubiquitin-protein ligase RHA2